MSNKFFWLSLFLALCFSPPLQAEDTNQTDDIQLVRNHDASIKDRIAAIDNLKETQPAGLVPILLEFVKSSEPEHLQFIAHVSDTLSSIQDPRIIPELKTILTNESFPSEKRKLALYILWRKSPETISPELIRIALDRKENGALRSSAIQYDGQLKNIEELKPLIPLLNQKREESSVRIAVLYALQNLDYFKINSNSLLEIIQDPSEDPALRKAALIVTSKNFPVDRWRDTLLTIIENRNNKLEIRSLALEHLKLVPSPTILPRLQKILDNESRPEMINAIDGLIKEIQNS